MREGLGGKPVDISKELGAAEEDDEEDVRVFPPAEAAIADLRL